MRFSSELLPARIVRRLGRFTVEVEREGELLAAHVANSGRIEELLGAGRTALLTPARDPGRQTAYDLVLVRLDNGWASADASLPNALVKEALEDGELPALQGFTAVRPEARLDDSRIDFLLTGPEGRCAVEVKSVTMVENGVALFPDAPSARAVRHLRGLADFAANGDQACVIFVVQRSDAETLRPNEAVDPAFAGALREVASRGVRLMAHRCSVSPVAIELSEEIAVQL